MKRNKDMMKKIFVTTCIVIMLIILAGMVVAYAGFGCSEVKIADGVSEILEKEGLDECRLISLPDYSGINYYLEIPDKSDVRDGKDSDDLITQELEMVSEKREEIMDQLRKPTNKKSIVN